MLYDLWDINKQSLVRYGKWHVYIPWGIISGNFYDSLNNVIKKSLCQNNPNKPFMELWRSNIFSYVL